MRKLIVISLIIIPILLTYQIFFPPKSVPVNFESLPTPTLFPPTETVIATGLPNRHLIQAPFIPQAPEKNWEQPWQDACEEAALLTVNYYYQPTTPNIANMISDYQTIFQAENNLGWGHDINLSQLSQLATDLFQYQTKILTAPDLDSLKKYLSSNIPIIIPANGKTLFQENKHFRSGGPWYHFLVLLGYDDQTKNFIVHDVGTQHGAYFQYSYDLILKAMHDLPPSGRKEDIDQGAKNALILLQ